MTTDVLLYSGWSSEANNKPQYYEKMCYNENGVNFNFALIAYYKYLQNKYTVNLNGLVKKVTAN